MAQLPSAQLRGRKWRVPENGDRTWPRGNPPPVATLLSYPKKRSLYTEVCIFTFCGRDFGRGRFAAGGEGRR
eukprot:3862827-Prymnesium_polylepis.1